MPHAFDAWRKPAPRRTPKFGAREHAQSPADRTGTSDDIAALKMFLASDAAAFISARNHVADRGMIWRMHYT